MVQPSLPYFLNYNSNLKIQSAFEYKPNFKNETLKRFLNIVYVALQNTVVIQFVSIWGFAPRVGLIVYHNVAGKFATLITI